MALLRTHRSARETADSIQHIDGPFIHTLVASDYQTRKPFLRMNVYFSYYQLQSWEKGNIAEIRLFFNVPNKRNV